MVRHHGGPPPGAPLPRRTVQPNGTRTGQCPDEVAAALHLTWPLRGQTVALVRDGDRGVREAAREPGLHHETPPDGVTLGAGGARDGTVAALVTAGQTRVGTTAGMITGKHPEGKDPRSSPPGSAIPINPGGHTTARRCPTTGKRLGPGSAVGPQRGDVDLPLETKGHR